MAARDKREKRKEKVVSARKRAQEHDQGNSRTYLRLPQGVSEFRIKQAGVYRLDIVPYTVGKGNPHASEGEDHFERTYFVHRGIGPTNSTYCCLKRNFGKACPICEYRAKLETQGEEELAESLKPKERQLFHVWDHSDKDKGVQIWDFPWWNFGKHLDNKILNSDDDEDGYAFFSSTSAAKGFTLKLGASKGKGEYTFFECTDIEFKKRREDLPDEIVDGVCCLDDIPIEMGYDELKAVLHQEGVPKNDDDDEDEDDKPSHKGNGKAASKGKKAVKEEDDDEDEDDQETKYKVGDFVLYRGKECEVKKIKDGAYYVEDEDGDDYKVTDESRLSKVKTKGKDDDDEEEDEDVMPPEEDEDEADDDVDEEDEPEDEEEEMAAKPKPGKKKEDKAPPKKEEPKKAEPKKKPGKK